MDASLILDNFFSPPILFFILGLAARLLRSDLEIPNQAARFLSLYLLFSIGLHGGHELRSSAFAGKVLLVLLAAMGSSCIIPIWSFFILRRRVSIPDAAAIAATYGSVSAVTFITAVGFLNILDVGYGGYMVAAMALMESPAIIVGILLARSGAGSSSEDKRKVDWSTLLREAFLNGSVFLLLGSLLIGIVTGEKGWEMLKPVAYDPFKGLLCLFLLDMGMVSAKRIGDLKSSGMFLVLFAVGAAVLHALLGIGLAYALNLEAGDALLLAVLAGSASYIAVPAAVRLAIPDANPSLYVPMSLCLTFPFNVVLGIPLYYTIIENIWRLS